MARRKSDSPQKAALREMMSNYMKENDVHIKDGMFTRTKKGSSLTRSVMTSDRENPFKPGFFSL